MPLSIRQVLPCFVGEVDGLDLTKPMPAGAIAAIHAGMDKYAALIFHDQDFADEQQLDFTRSLGAIELAFGTSLRRPEDYLLPTTFIARGRSRMAKRATSGGRR
jgi:alpha-ketoglutarate-dependent 2,4-dichlorophenoxyacetate dioxygenase